MKFVVREFSVFCANQLRKVSSIMPIIKHPLFSSLLIVGTLNSLSVHAQLNNKERARSFDDRKAPFINASSIEINQTFAGRQLHLARLQDELADPRVADKHQVEKPAAPEFIGTLAKKRKTETLKIKRAAADRKKLAHELSMIELGTKLANSELARWIWAYQETIDPVTKEIAVYATSFGGNRGASSVRCERGALKALFHIDKFLGNGAVPVTYRIDGDKPITSKWSPSPAGTAVFVSEVDETERLVRSMLTGKKFLLLVTDYSGTEYLVIQPLEGSFRPIQKVMNHCSLAL